MKIINLLFILAILSSCAPEPEPEVAEGTMHCTLNGSPWSAISPKGKLLVASIDGDTGKRILISGKSGANLTIQLNAIELYTPDSNPKLSPGAYNFSSGTNKEGEVLIVSGLNIVASGGVAEGSGVINITGFNSGSKKCSGTFSFEAIDTDGEEDVLYTATLGTFTNVPYIIE